MSPYFDRPDRVALLEASAHTWLGTPFVPHGDVCHAGVDCVHLPLRIYAECGLALDRAFPSYTMDGGDHRGSSQVIEWLEGDPGFVRTRDTQAGDLGCFRIGRVPHHVGLVLSPTTFVHAMRNYGVIISRLDDPTFARRLMAFYRPLQP
jgi:cell wall-associated NlpC family hydrolase